MSEKVISASDRQKTSVNRILENRKTLLEEAKDLMDQGMQKKLDAQGAGNELEGYLTAVLEMHDVSPENYTYNPETGVFSEIPGTQKPSDVLIPEVHSVPETQ